MVNGGVGEGGSKARLDNIGDLGGGSSQKYGVSLAVTTRNVAEVGVLVVVRRIWEVPGVSSTGDAGEMPILEDGLG